jgi:hypothetical protein
MANPKLSIALLDDLNKFGFTDEAFKLLHHSRVNGWTARISGHRRYCARISSFHKDSNNERVQLRLEFVLKRYREAGYPPGQVDIFVKLADEAFKKYPPL